MVLKRICGKLVTTNKALSTWNASINQLVSIQIIRDLYGLYLNLELPYVD